MIHVLDWILYFVILWLYWKILTKDVSKEMDTVLDCIIITVYTIFYCIVFWHFDWVTLFTDNGIANYFTW
jgi:hypothetical protein